MILAKKSYTMKEKGSLVFDDKNYSYENYILELFQTIPGDVDPKLPLNLRPSLSLPSNLIACKSKMGRILVLVF